MQLPKLILLIGLVTLMGADKPRDQRTTTQMSKSGKSITHYNTNVYSQGHVTRYSTRELRSGNTIRTQTRVYGGNSSSKKKPK